jgi:hypothetical protein
MLKFQENYFFLKEKKENFLKGKHEESYLQYSKFFQMESSKLIN